VGSFNSKLLAVGAPGYRNSSGGTVGAVHIFSTRDSIVSNLTRQCSIVGDGHLSDFGAALAVSSPNVDAAVLAIGAPSEGEEGQALRAGVVRLVNVSLFLHRHCIGGRNLTLVQLGEGNHSTDDGTLRAKIRGPRLSRFGRVLQFGGGFRGESGDYPNLLVAAPLANAGIDTFPVISARSRETGAVYGWAGDSLPQGGVGAVALDASKTATWRRLGTTSHGRLGSSLSVMRSLALVVVGAPLSSRTGIEMAGEVEILPWK
jgi:hypothetical protein